MNKILYNVTVKVDHDSVEKWQEYMIENHILDVMNTGCFESFKLNKLKFLDEEDGVTFAVQYVSKNMAEFQRYHADHANKLQADHGRIFGEKAQAFRTVMEILHES